MDEFVKEILAHNHLAMLEAEISDWDIIGDFFTPSLHELFEILISIRNVNFVDLNQIDVPAQLERAVDLSEWLSEYAWDALHSLYWKDVNINWRSMYSVVVMLSVACDCLVEFRSLKIVDVRFYKDVLRKCDDGIILGKPVWDKILHRMANWLHDQIVTAEAGGIDHASVTESNADGCAFAPIAEYRIEDYFEADSRLKPYSSSVPALIDPTLHNFLQNYFRPSRPCVIRQPSSIRYAWPAFEKWSVDYLRNACGYRTVPVETGSSYANHDAGQRLMTINEFIDSVLVRKEIKGYLAQYALFDHIDRLRSDIDIPEFCLVGDSDDDEETSVEMNAWFGGKTMSPLHFDPRPNLFVQVLGCKYVRLYDPVYSANLYPHDGHKLLSNTSQIDLDAREGNRRLLVDEKRFGKFFQTYFYETIVQRGDLLFIPPKWWHYVKSMDDLSFSVNFWFD